jgi:hypothetical protein
VRSGGKQPHLGWTLLSPPPRAALDAAQGTRPVFERAREPPLRADDRSPPSRPAWPGARAVPVPFAHTISLLSYALVLLLAAQATTVTLGWGVPLLFRLCHWTLTTLVFGDVLIFALMMVTALSSLGFAGLGAFLLAWRVSRVVLGEVPASSSLLNGAAAANTSATTPTTPTKGKGRTATPADRSAEVWVWRADLGRYGPPRRLRRKDSKFSLPAARQHEKRL